MSICISNHFDCTGSHQMLAPGLAFGIFPVTFRTRCLLCNVCVHFDCPGSRKVCVPVLGSVFLLNIFLLNFIIFLLNIHIIIFLSPPSSSSSSSSSSPSSSYSSARHHHHHHHHLLPLTIITIIIIFILIIIHALFTPSPHTVWGCLGSLAGIIFDRSLIIAIFLGDP